jgi:hypothetical protein
MKKEIIEKVVVSLFNQQKDFDNTTSQLNEIAVHIDGLEFCVIDEVLDLLNVPRSEEDGFVRDFLIDLFMESDDPHVFIKLVKQYLIDNKDELPK